MRSLFLVALVMFLASPMVAQHPPGRQSSPNVHVLSHIPTGGPFTGSDIELEQEVSRPYAYVSTMTDMGLNIVSVANPSEAKVIWRWQIENAELHQGPGTLDNKYFKVNDRYYDVQSVQFGRSGPDADVGAVVFDVTGLPDPATVREVGRIRVPDLPGGFHNIFVYKHSTGAVLLFATINALPSTPHGANVYDMDRFVAGVPDHGLIAGIPLPEPRGAPGGYHDMYVAYDPATRQDKFYGGGPEITPLGGYYVFDITDLSNPELLVTMQGVAGNPGGHTFVASPDGRYGLTWSALEMGPFRTFDLKPALTGEVKNISRSIGAWTPDWKNKGHNAEIRWPYAFVAAYEDGMYVINLMDPTNPYTVGYWDTYDGPHAIQGWGTFRRANPRPNASNGGFGVDVRNADGLIVVNDMHTGFWVLRMDGFDGWNGHQWGMPNVSSAQDWDRGPEGAPAPARVSLR